MFYSRRDSAAGFRRTWRERAAPGLMIKALGAELHCSRRGLALCEDHVKKRGLTKRLEEKLCLQKREKKKGGGGENPRISLSDE